MNPTAASLPRRNFLRNTLQTAGAVTIGGVLQSFLSCSSGAESKPRATVGPLKPVKDEHTGEPLLLLPDGFRYVSYGFSGDKMSDGRATPSKHDGMAVIRADGDRVTICRNHEVDTDTGTIGPAEQSYDVKAGGGCTWLEFDVKRGQWISSRTALSGTVRNCAGGATPWGTWLSCEETVIGPMEPHNDKPRDHQQTHGWIFEVSPDDDHAPSPLKDMGRFWHEAVAVDPRTKIVYETEDRTTAGFYRFLPNSPGKLAEGGRLQMMRVPGQDDLSRGVKVGTEFSTEWVAIADPERPHHKAEEKDSLGVFMQGKAAGGTTFARLEGCWWSDDEAVFYFTATIGGEKECGQVWRYDPERERLKLVFESPGREVLDMPDNLTVSPGGGLVLCEDGNQAPQRMHGLTTKGVLFPLAANNVTWKGTKYHDQEWAGACFSPDGQWLFANLQTPGITVAITGPWSNAGL